jgi:IS4 transposase
LYGPNVRFVVTNRRGRAADIFAWYHQRGQAENFIKELKRDLAADRLSCHAFRANAFRLLLGTPLSASGRTARSSRSAPGSRA